MGDRIVIGSETQQYESIPILSGIQRVVHDVHVGLVDRLTPRGVDLLPLHTRRRPREVRLRAHRYLADDPLLDRHPRFPDEVDAFVLLDPNLNCDLVSIHRSLAVSPRPVIALVHDTIPLKSPEYFESEVVTGFRLYLQPLLHIADHVVVTSQQVADDIHDLKWRIKGHVHVLPLGSTFDPVPPALMPNGRISIMYVSTIDPRKGHAELIEAFDTLRRLDHDVDLTIIGRAGWKMNTFFESLVGHPDFGARLRWLDSASDSSLTTEARRCSIGVFPSADEGFGLFVEEGLALGLKMVVSDIPVFREREQPNLFFSDRDPSSLAEAILTAHRTPWQRPTTPIRLMFDFVDDFVDLITRVVIDQRRV